MRRGESANSEDEGNLIYDSKSGKLRAQKFLQKTCEEKIQLKRYMKIPFFMTLTRPFNVLSFRPPTLSRLYQEPFLQFGGYHLIKGP